MHTLPPAYLPVCWPGCSAQATAHPATCLFACLLARLLCPGYSAQATAHPASCLPVCYLDRLLCPGYCTPCHLPACLFAGQATLPRLLHTLPPACLHVFLPGYSAKATAHPADCLLACPFACEATLPSKPCRLTACLPACLPDRQAVLRRLLCPGYCTPCRLPACLFAGQATLPRLLHTLPPACLQVCWPGYSAQATATPCLLPACFLARLLCPG